MEDVGGSKVRRQMHLWEGSWREACAWGEMFWLGRRLAWAHGLLHVGMGAGRLEGALGWKLAPGVAAAQ